MKKCPYCAEDIQDAAIVCRYCGRDLVPLQQGVVPSVTPLVAPPGKETLTRNDVLLAFLLPIAGLLIGVAYLTNPLRRDRAINLILVSFIAWVVWAAVCASSGLMYWL